MTNTLLRRLALSCTAALLAGAAMPAAFAQDRELQEAAGMAGTVMYLSDEVPALIFGAVRNGETAFFGFGETSDGSAREPDENSIFRIASVSKVFCGNVLGSLVVDGHVGLTDPLQAYVGDGVTIPTKDGRTLRLLDLVGQTAGLPREVSRPDSPPEDPFASNTHAVQLAEIQKDDPFLFAPGTSAFYSNYGYDLLGLALSNAAGKPYADLLKERILDPLGMKDTTFNPPADAQDRLMQGHFFDGSPMPNVPTPVGIECAGGLHTTGADMLRFIQWNLDQTGEELREVREITQAAHVYRDGLKAVVGIDDAGPMGAMGLGWVINFPEGNRPLILEKTGGLQGFFTYVAIAPTRGVGAFFVMNEFNAGAFHGAVTATNNFVAAMATR